jgi:hypothetical protein
MAARPSVFPWSILHHAALEAVEVLQLHVTV